jgi:hypothetical protein
VDLGGVLDNPISMWINIWDEDTCKTTSQHNTENKYAHYKLEEKGGSETWLPTLNLGTPLALFHLVSFLEDYVTCKSIPHLSFDTLFHFPTIHCDGYFFLCHISFDLHLFPALSLSFNFLGILFSYWNLSSLVPKENPKKKKRFFVRGHMQKATLLTFCPKQKKQKW